MKTERTGSMSGVRETASAQASSVLCAPVAAVEVWGVLNVTPDSFSDGGRFLDPRTALEHALRMASEGADVIDVGGASSRPPGTTYGVGAQEVDVAEEIRRTEPVVRALVARGLRVSIDTVRGEVARAALGAGATIVNDVSMGSDAELVRAAAGHGATLVLMHNRGDGRVTGPRPADVVALVRSELAAAVEGAIELGVARARIWVDPGIGFAKTADESTTLLARLGELGGDLAKPEAAPLQALRVLVGASRKSFVAALAPERDGSPPPPTDRLGGSLAAVTAAVLGGASAVRVHDVRESRQAALVALALRARREVPRG